MTRFRKVTSYSYSVCRDVSTHTGIERCVPFKPPYIFILFIWLKMITNCKFTCITVKAESTYAKVHDPNTTCLKCFPSCYYAITRQAISMAKSHQYQWLCKISSKYSLEFTLPIMLFRPWDDSALLSHHIRCIGVYCFQVVRDSVIPTSFPLNILRTNWWNA